MNDDKEKIEKYIMLSIMDGLGPVFDNSIIGICGGIDACFSMSDEDILHNAAKSFISQRKVKAFLAQRNDSFIRDAAERILSEAEGAGMDIVTYEDIRYPDRFKGLVDVPALLYVKGELRINEYVDSVGIVGARRCSHEGKEKAIIAAERAVSENKVVISGMAKGIDSYAHTATIKGNGYTIAVLGSGADICYPKEHEKLYEEIIKTGCILSEYPPGTTPKNFHFPMRNRLIAALSDKLYVIDVGRNSGTSSTVESGERYGREIEVMAGI